MSSQQRWDLNERFPNLQSILSALTLCKFNNPEELKESLLFHPSVFEATDKILRTNGIQKPWSVPVTTSTCMCSDVCFTTHMHTVRVVSCHCTCWLDVPMYARTATPDEYLNTAIVWRKPGGGSLIASSGSDLCMKCQNQPANLLEKQREKRNWRHSTIFYDTTSQSAASFNSLQLQLYGRREEQSGSHQTF